MSDREKLIELFDEANKICVDTACCKCSYAIHRGKCVDMFFIDYFISNGVTVQKWIPVGEPPKDTGEYNVMIYGATKATSLFYDFGNDRWFDIGDEEFVVTHWMPLPEPPEGV